MLVVFPLKWFDRLTMSGKRASHLESAIFIAMTIGALKDGLD